MRPLILALALVLSQIVAVAKATEYGQYDIKKVVTITQSAAGQNSATISFAYLDQIIDDLSSHAANYPPRFDSPDDLYRARVDVKALSAILDTLLSSPSPDRQILLRAGVLNSIGHNLDVPGCADRAIGAFTALLRQTPDDPRANYFYGRFLTGAGKPADAIPFLEKAKSLGDVNADYTLGIAYLSEGDKAKALDNLELYARRVPNDANAAKMIDALRNGSVQIKKVNP